MTGLYSNCLHIQISEYCSSLITITCELQIILKNGRVLRIHKEKSCLGFTDAVIGEICHTIGPYHIFKPKRHKINAYK